MPRLKRTERGWPAHYCLGHRCVFHRNTLLEIGRRKIVVSTVGDLRRDSLREETTDKIGSDQYYETKVFRAEKAHQSPYKEADVHMEYYVDAMTMIFKLTDDVSIKADEMHERVVDEVTHKLIHSITLRSSDER